MPRSARGGRPRPAPAALALLVGALLLGALLLGVGVGAGLPHLATVGWTPPTVLGLASLAAGLVLVAVGFAGVLLVTAGERSDEGYAAAGLRAAAPDRVEVWTVPGSDHAGGLAAAPEEWERRVVAFLDRALPPVE